MNPLHTERFKKRLREGEKIRNESLIQEAINKSFSCPSIPLHYEIKNLVMCIAYVSDCVHSNESRLEQIDGLFDELVTQRDSVDFNTWVERAARLRTTENAYQLAYGFHDELLFDLFHELLELIFGAEVVERRLNELNIPKILGYMDEYAVDEIEYLLTEDHFHYRPYDVERVELGLERVELEKDGG